MKSASSETSLNGGGKKTELGTSGSSDVKVYKSHAFKAWALGLPEVHSCRATLQNAWRKIGSHQKTAEKQWLFGVLSRQSYCLLETHKTGESFAMLAKHMGNNTHGNSPRDSYQIKPQIKPHSYKLC